MKRAFVAIAVVGLLVVVALASRQTPAGSSNQPKPDFEFTTEAVNPVNHTKLNNAASTFRFAIVTDRTGGVRAGVFEKAVDQLNLMQPEFVVCVGDLITGQNDLDKLNKEWEQFNGFIKKLEMPFFYLPGNHDIVSKLAEKRWQEQFGRTYYHFVYKNVLFLMLNTEDVPGDKNAAGKFTDKQIGYAKQTLAKYKDVRWTLVFFHRPVWTYANGNKTTGFGEIEQALQGRKYTVFAGHKHNYELTVRNGMKYIMLGTTGGVSKLRGVPFGELDHLMWVTMKDSGPVLVNYAMEGILPEDLRVAKTKAAAEE